VGDCLRQLLDAQAVVQSDTVEQVADGGARLGAAVTEVVQAQARVITSRTAGQPQTYMLAAAQPWSRSPSGRPARGHCCPSLSGAVPVVFSRATGTAFVQFTEHIDGTP
jgi:endonuclease/exonuclease/phosphatase (EEP) superfamily protein YafD